MVHTPQEHCAFVFFFNHYCQYSWSFLGRTSGKEQAGDKREVGLIPGSGSRTLKKNDFSCLFLKNLLKYLFQRNGVIKKEEDFEQ